MLAAELSRLLGTDLGLESPRQILEEIAAIAPSHAGLTPEVLHAHGSRDGVVVGGVGRQPRRASDPTDPGVDPAAGEAAVAAEAADTDEEQQAAEAEATEAQADAEARDRAGRSRRPLRAPRLRPR